jgi:hypothetical protein
MEAPTFASGSREYPLKDKKEQKQKAEHLSLEKYKANIDMVFLQDKYLLLQKIMQTKDKNLLIMKNN